MQPASFAADSTGPSASDWDVLIIGAGPAGLTAAIYLARFRRRVLVVHDGQSRAARIPLTYNVPGFPGGVAGQDLLGRMQEQVALYGGKIAQDRIDELSRTDRGFKAIGAKTYRARALILATGISLNQIELDHEVHEAAIAAHCLRYCPICDGYEATDKAVGVVGSTVHGASEALFLRQYTDKVVLMPKMACELTASQREELAQAGVEVIDTPVAQYSPGDDHIQIVLEGGRALRFDVLYPALGCTPRSELAGQLGVALSEDGCIPTDPKQQVSMPGLYAAGDVVEALDQITVAIGHGAVAATGAHNFLRHAEGMMLEERDWS